MLRSDWRKMGGNQISKRDLSFPGSSPAHHNNGEIAIFSLSIFAVFWYISLIQKLIRPEPEQNIREKIPDHNRK
jgi:hypothetical protein